MHKTTHNKLVRDKIPDIMESKGDTCKTRILERNEFINCLIAKLIEETEEFAKDRSIEELADIYEVLHALMKATYGFHETVAAATNKRVKNGGFEYRIFLMSSEGRDKCLS